MPVAVTFPTNSELMSIQQELLPQLTEDDLIFRLMPIVNRDAALVEWEQMDNFTGLMQIRGLDGEPPSVPNVGLKKYRMEPGTYGEWAPITELELTTRRVPGTYNQPINIDNIVMIRQNQLLNRRLDRIRWILWTLLVSGTFTVPGVNGQVLHAGSFLVQTATATVVWTTVATAAPLADFRSLLLLYAGRSISFGPDARFVMNRITFNQMMLNTNQNDIGGRRLANGANLNSVTDVNVVLAANDLPPIEIYDKGYYPDGGGAFTRFIPNGKVVVIGQRPNGETIGEFQMTRNANNADLSPGPYTYVSDSLDSGKPVPRKLRVDDGFNGGPALFFPGAVIVLTAY
jgi:hypothetical protein